MARVIRGPGAARVVPVEVVDAREEAARIVDAARAEAAAMIEAARAEQERLRADARREAHEEARAEAAALLVEAARARDLAREEAARDARTLALAAAERIAGEAIALEPERIVAIVREAIGRTRRARAIEVRAHPDDVRAIEAASLPVLRVVADASMARGGCVVRSELGTVDARVEVRLDAMARVLGCEPPERS